MADASKSTRERTLRRSFCIVQLLNLFCNSTGIICCLSHIMVCFHWWMHLISFYFCMFLWHSGKFPLCLVAHRVCFFVCVGCRPRLFFLLRCCLLGETQIWLVGFAGCLLSSPFLLLVVFWLPFVSTAGTTAFQVSFSISLTESWSDIDQTREETMLRPRTHNKPCHLVVLVAQLVSRHSCVADRLLWVVRFPAGPRVRLKTVDPPKGNGLGQKNNKPCLLPVCPMSALLFHLLHPLPLICSRGVAPKWVVFAFEAKRKSGWRICGRPCFVCFLVSLLLLPHFASL